MKTLVLAAALSLGAAIVPAHAAFEPVYFPEYTLSYDDTTVLGGLAFNFGGGGSVGFGWNLPDSISVSDGTMEFALPSFIVTAAPGYTLSGWLSGFLGNLSYAEAAGGVTGASLRGSVSIDGGAGMDFDEVLGRTEIISTPGISTGYYSISGSAPYGDFTMLEVTGLTLTLSASSSAAVYSADQGKLEVSFVATPVPEAETYGMLLAGLGIVSMIARRRLSR